MKAYLGSIPRGKNKNYRDQLFNKCVTLDLDDKNTWLFLNKFDYSCIEFKGGKRKETNFIGADCLYIDFDHFLDNPDPDQMLKIQSQILSPLHTPCFAIPSHSQLGFHAFFPIGSTVTDIKEYKSIYKALIEKLGGKADPQVKDGARIGFGSDIQDSLFLAQSQSINPDLSINLPNSFNSFKSSFNSTETFNNQETEYDVFTEGSRNSNCHKLACSLLNRYDVPTAHSIYESKCQNNGLSENELESCFKSAVNSMIEEGMAYTDPKQRAENSETVKIMQTPDPYQAKTTEGKKTWIDKEKDYKPQFMKDYSLYGKDKALKILREKLKFNSESASFSSHICLLASSRWISYDFYEGFINELSKMGWDLKRKDLNSILESVSDKNSKSDKAVTYIPQLTGWFAYNSQNGKWESATEGECSEILKGFLAQLDDDIHSCHYLDTYLEANVKKALNLQNLGKLLKSYATTSYAKFEKGLEYSIPCPVTVYKFDEEGNLTSEKITPKSYILNEFKVDPVFEKSELWEKTLKEIVPDSDDRHWLQVALGSQLLGIRPMDQVMYFWIGTKGANGKSTIFNAVAQIFADYSRFIQPDTFNENQKTKEAEYARAEFMGKRMVIASEASQKFSLDTSMVKMVCSSEDIEASRKYVNKFVFIPSHHVSFVANYMPTIVNPDDGGLRRRIKVFHFDQHFDESKADKQLGKKLEKEYPKILAWLMEGTKEFIKNGYKLPYNKHVEEWTNQELKENDYFDDFLTDVLDDSDSTFVKTSDLRALYSEWQKLNPGSQKLTTREFGMKLKKHGKESETITVGGEKSSRGIKYASFNKQSTIWHTLSESKYHYEMPFKDYPMQRKVQETYYDDYEDMGF